MMVRGMLMAAIISVSVSHAGLAQGPEGVGDDDCVVFYGDQTVYPPDFGYVVEHFVRVRYPSSAARYWHVGVPTTQFARMEELNAWFDDLVVPLQPTVIVLSTGLGDGELKEPSEARLAVVATEFEKLIERCQTTGARVYVITPPPPGVTRKRVLGAIRYDETVRSIGRTMSEIASRESLPVLDWYGGVAKMQREGVTEDLSGRDGLTPTSYSHSVIANEVIKAWRLAPLDATLTLNWKGRSVTTTHGAAQVVEESPTALRLRLSDFPMPLRIDPRPEGAVPPAWLDRCRIVLKIVGVPDGTIRLSEVGAREGTLSLPTSAFSDGVNLAAGSPLTQNETVANLVNRIGTKNAAMRTIGATLQRYRAEPDEPEIMEAINAFVDASRKYVMASETVLRRTPRTMNIELRIELESGGN